MGERMHLNAVNKLSIILVSLLSLINITARAAELTIKVEGDSTDGNIGCALFSNPKGFPMDAAGAIQKFSPNTPTGSEFIFSNLKSGKYAVSVMNDQNGNKILDKNLLGIPKEEWGVSNNIRPTLRAPKFEEAVFEIDEKSDLTLKIRIQK
jgi:uncharacterized protein (DUF2141 family)